LEETKGSTGAILAQAFALIVVLTILLMIISFPVGLYAMFYTKLSNSTTYNSSLNGIVLLVALIPLRIPVHTSVGTAFAGFLAVYALFFTVAAFQRVRILSAVKEFASGGRDAMLQNPLSATVITLGAITFGLTILDIVQTRGGIPTGQLSGDPLRLFLGITMAPLTEEFGFRFALIGIPMFIAATLANRSLVRGIRTLWRPSAAWQQSNASVHTVNPPTYTLQRLFAYVLLFLSSAVFGLAHYLSNAGWDVGKISQASIAGVALGYLYIRYGFHTSVLLHWGVNYFGTAYAFLSQGLWNIPWTSDTGSSLSLFVEVIIILVLGLPSFFMFIFKFLKRGSEGAEVVD
jgi:hypothetical protein